MSHDPHAPVRDAADLSIAGAEQGHKVPFYVPGHESGATRQDGMRDVPATAYHTETSPQGPPLVQQLIDSVGGEQAAHLIAAIMRDNKTEKRKRVMQGIAPFNTDASGNAVAKFFDVPQGFQAVLCHALLELQGKVPGSAGTANAWAAILEGEQGTFNASGGASAPALGQVRAFAPVTGGGSLALPAMLVDDGETSGWAFRSGTAAIVQIGGSQAGLANLAGALSYRFMLREVE